MKTKNKTLILLLSIFLLFSIQLGSFVSFSFADINTETSTVRSNWLYVDVGDFVDSSQTPWENRLKITSGGSDLKSFQNLGMVSATDEAILYKSSAIFGFEVSAHTVVGFQDAFPFINREVKETYPFFQITKQSAFLTPITYSVSYFNINKGAYREHSYEGHIPITVGLRDTTSMQSNIQINGQTFQMPEYVADIMGAKVDILRDGIVGEYTDEFEDISGIEEGDVSLQTFSNYPDVDQILTNYLNNYNLGFTIGDVEEGQTIQQKVLDGSQGGHEFQNPSPAKDKTFTFQLYSYIQPEISEFVQYNEVRYAAINYDDWGINVGKIDVVLGPASRVLPKRTVGIHAENYFLHWDLSIEVEFYATIPSTAELTEAILDDPYLQMGDFIWDTSVTGDYHVEIPLTYSSLADFLAEIFGIFGGIFGFIIFIILIGIGLYLFIRIGVPYLIRRSKKKSDRKRRR